MLNTTTFEVRRITVAVSGTPVQGDTRPIPDGVAVVVRAAPTNTGVMTVGDSSANALNTAARSTRLQNGDSVSFQVTNLNAIWADATVAGEHVEVIYEF